MADSRTFTLTDVSQLLRAPQHRLIHLCEKGVIEPDVEDARGRGSSRLFSARNVLEFALALRLREVFLPIAVVRAVLYVLRSFERELRKEMPEFSLPQSLRIPSAPDLRIVIKDGEAIYFSLARKGSKPTVFGGVPLNPLIGAKPSSTRAAQPLASRPRRGAPASSAGFGEPEGSRYARVELSVTAVARDLPID